MRSAVSYIFVCNLQRNTNGPLNASAWVVVHQKRVIPVGDDNCLKRIFLQGRVKVDAMPYCLVHEKSFRVDNDHRQPKKYFIKILLRKRSFIKYFERPIQRVCLILYRLLSKYLIYQLIQLKVHVSQSSKVTIHPGRETDT